MGGEGGGGGGGQGGSVRLLVNRLKKSEASRKVSKFVKPRGRRGVKKDTLVQTRILSIESRRGVRKITGLCENGKRKLVLTESDSPGAKLQNFDKDL